MGRSTRDVNPLSESFEVTAWGIFLLDSSFAKLHQKVIF